MINFTKRIAFAGMCVVMLTPASAQLSGRVVKAPKSNAAVTASMKPVSKAAKTPFGFKRVANPTDYGKEVVIVSEDFSKMSTGSEEEPDFDTDMNFEPEDNVWINMYDDFTQTPGWGSTNAYPAGGAIYLDTDGKNENGRLTSPLLDLTKNTGIGFIQFDVRRPSIFEDDAEMVLLEAAETRHMGPTWDFLGNVVLPAITPEWQTLTYMFYNCGPSTMFNIVNVDLPIIIDNVKVFQIEQYAATPVTYKHSDYVGVDDNTATFNLRWNKVDGAEGYVLNVYELDNNGEPTKYAVQNKEVNDTTFTVDNAVSGDIYYYTVSSMKDGHVSIPSSAIEIKDVAAPFVKVSNEMKDGKYTAEWNNVNGAERYNYISKFKRVADKDGEFTVTSLNLQGLPYRNPETEIEFSVDNPDSHTYDRGVLVDEAGQAGWQVKHYAIYKDALTIDAFWTTEAKSDAGLISPEMDLSKDNGKFKVDLKACAEYLKYYEAYPQCGVALFNYNEDAKDYVQSELIYAGDYKIDGEWKDYSCEFSTGTDRSIVGIYGVYAPGNLYLANVKITQNYKAGEYLYDPFHYDWWVAPEEDAKSTSLDITVPAKADKAEVYHQAQSVRLGSAGDQFSSASFLESSFSPLQKVGVADVSTAIAGATVNLSGATVRLEGNNIVVNNPKNAPVYVYTMDGAVVASDNSCGSTVSIPAPGHGSYVVKVGKQSVKLTF